MTTDLASNSHALNASERDFERFSRLVSQLTGIALKSNRRAMIEARVSKLLKSLDIGSLKELCDLAEIESGSVERDAIIATMTTNMTRFSREPHHFDYLKEKIFPNLLRAPGRDGPLRIWSAGCSSGEEAYSALFAFADLLGLKALPDIQVLGTDIDPVVLQKAEKGRYDQQVVTKVKEMKVDEYFSSDRSGVIEVKPEIRRRVRFRRLNLMDAHQFKSPFDVIFCRNVAIYFEKDQQDDIWRMLINNLKVGGYLIIGHSETIADYAKLSLSQVSAGIFSKGGGDMQGSVVAVGNLEASS